MGGEQRKQTQAEQENTSPPINVLISLHRGYGLGDAVQCSAVLRHVAKYRPRWHIDYQAEEGKHQVGRGIVDNTFAYGQPYPSPHYDAEVQIVLYDTWSNWGDRPNTRVSSCLHTLFDLPWDRNYGRYRVEVSVEAENRAVLFTVPHRIHTLTRSGIDSVRKWIAVNGRTVTLHYRGDSSPDKKNLSHAQAAQICKRIEQLKHIPLLLYWRNQSPLTAELDICSTGRLPTSREWGADAEMNCAVISQCKAFVGIDSGPSKCASATDTPALVVWTGHSPIPFHDPSPNTTHLVPAGYNGCYPVVEDQQVKDWFESNYNVRWYKGDPVKEIVTWLEEVLK